MLAAAAFVYVTAENLPIGLLPQMSGGLHVSGGAIGMLVTIYAAIAGLTAIPLTAWSGHLPRRWLVVGAVALLAVSQLVIAVAPDYAVVVGARAVCAVAHGVFWSVIAPIAADLVEPERAARAVALVFTGNSLALVAGTPIASALGTALSWRVSSAIVGVVAAIASVALLAVLPDLPAAAGHLSTRDRLAAIPAAARNGPLLSVCGITAVLVIGHFSAYTYITELIRRDAGLTGLGLSAALLVFGVAGMAGNLLGGWLTDLRPRRAAVSCAFVLAVALTLLAAIGPGSRDLTIVALCLWGAAFLALPVCLQSGVLRVAGPDADTSSALYVVAFQIGIGGGALVGSLLDGVGRLAALPAVGAGCSVVGLVSVALARRAFPAQSAPGTAG